MVRGSSAMGSQFFGFRVLLSEEILHLCMLERKRENVCGKKGSSKISPLFNRFFPLFFSKLVILPKAI